MRKELTCIGCPMGCQLTAVVEGNEVVSVEGNTCAKGVSYAKKECIAPQRTVTSSVRVEGGVLKMVSVKTAEEIPKDKTGSCMKALKDICVKAPVHIGDIILADVAGTGVNIIATKNIDPAERALA